MTLLDIHSSMSIILFKRHSNAYQQEAMTIAILFIRSRCIDVILMHPCKNVIIMERVALIGHIMFSLVVLAPLEIDVF